MSFGPSALAQLGVDVGVQPGQYGCKIPSTINVTASTLGPDGLGSKLLEGYPKIATAWRNFSWWNCFEFFPSGVSKEADVSKASLTLTETGTATRGSFRLEIVGGAERKGHTMVFHGDFSRS